MEFNNDGENRIIMKMVKSKNKYILNGTIINYYR